MRPGLRLRSHRGTTAHLASLYPFSVQPRGEVVGPYVGLDLLAGGSEFCWDPFDAYAAGVVTNPNCWILGEPGNGKSALVKCLLWRMAGIYGTGDNGRWFAIADPKGEYAPLGERLGLTTVRLAPGGVTRVNPLEDLSRPGTEPLETRVLRCAEMVAALLATVLARPLGQAEDVAVFTAIEALGRQPRTATLADLLTAISNPDTELAQAVRRSRDQVTADLSAIRFALEKLLARSLRGMFDGASTVDLAGATAGVLLDLSAIPLDSEALPLVMVAAAGWLGQLLAGGGPRRVQVIDEAWALLGNRHTASYLQTCFKLGRTYGVANICISHRPSDLGAQADDGTATAKIAGGLLADAATKILLCQAPDQLIAARQAVGLTEPEAQIVGGLTRGRALWRVGARTSVVQHVMNKREEALCDTDSRMGALNRARAVA